MSGSVQAPLSPILQERRDSATNSANKKRPFNHHHHHHHHQHAKNHWKHRNQHILTDGDKSAKKRQKVQLPSKFLLGNF
jgi:hypothetical protein